MQGQQPDGKTTKLLVRVFKLNQSLNIKAIPKITQILEIRRIINNENEIYRQYIQNGKLQ